MIPISMTQELCLRFTIMDIPYLPTHLEVPSVQTHLALFVHKGDKEQLRCNLNIMEKRVKESTRKLDFVKVMNAEVSFATSRLFCS